MTVADVDLDALLDALQARAAVRAAAQPLTNVNGEDVAGLAAAGLVTVNPGDLITSNWGNATYRQTMVVFATVADRNAQWTNAADGAICYTLDTGTAWIRRIAQWVPLTAGRYQVRATRAAAFTFPATANQVVNLIYDTKAAGTDPTNAYNTATGVYTCPAAGVYFVRMSWSLVGTAGTLGLWNIVHNGAAEAAANIPVAPTSNAAMIFGTSTLCQCAAGDTISFNGSCSPASLGSRLAGSETHMAIANLGPP